jgi:hypothetical protein
VHVPGERGRAAVAAELRRCEAIGEEIGAEASVGFRDADGEKPLAVHIAEILERERRVAVVLGRARCQDPPSEAACLADQVGREIRKPERIGSEDRSVEVVRVEFRSPHRSPPLKPARGRSTTAGPC